MSLLCESRCEELGVVGNRQAIGKVKSAVPFIPVHRSKYFTADAIHISNLSYDRTWCVPWCMLCGQISPL